MTPKRIQTASINNGPYLIALHSCSTNLGVAIIDSRSPKTSLKSCTFPIGRNLSNKIINCVNQLLPCSYWSKIGRIAVSIGPGGFTSTRITVVMGRTLAQQLNCELDGISSFALMAPRLANSLTSLQKTKPFWIVKDLPRRGLIVGKYQIQENLEENSMKIVRELKRPHLLSPPLNISPTIQASDNVELDVIHLLKISLMAHKVNQESQWQNVIPIYPTSPVG